MLSRTFVLVLTLAAAMATPAGQQPSTDQDPSRFKSGVELVSITATVADSGGRFVTGLTQNDFRVYEDGVPQTVSYFSADRAPVSLGLVVDTSGSMAGEKIDAARRALDRFLFDLLEPDDEVFLVRFSDTPLLLQNWTSNRAAVSDALGRAAPRGGTAMYDAIREAIPIAALGTHPKKALVVISDGNDTSSRSSVRDVKRVLRESEVLVYAIGIDGEAEIVPRQPPRGRSPLPPRSPFPVPFPGGPRRPGGFLPQFGPRSSWGTPGDERVNAGALREITDDSGGRTEIVREPRDLGPATTSIADELSRQYSLGYASTGTRDGRWHAIRVEAASNTYRVRARSGYVAN